MPQSLVLNLIAQSAISQKYLQGRAPQQLFFDLVDEVDPELGNILRQDEQSRAYSLSALQIDLRGSQAKATRPEAVGTATAKALPVSARVARRNVRLLTTRTDLPLQFSHRQAIESGTRCWWRITFLDDELFDHLIFLWNQLLSEPFQLGGGTVAITNVTADMPNLRPSVAPWPGMNWASSCSYRDLYETASAYEQDIHIQFITPTAFEEEGCVSPMPTAGAVFHPLRKCWNRYSGLAFAPSLVKNIVPMTFNIRTEAIHASSVTKTVSETLSGCVGQVSFRILGDDPLTTKRLNALADFSCYCGIGYGTPVGLGTVRRLSGSSAKIVPSRIHL